MVDMEDSMIAQLIQDAEVRDNIMDNCGVGDVH